MEELNYLYTRYKEEKAKFETLENIDPKNDDSLYKYLLHKLRDLREDLTQRIDEIYLELDRVKRVLEYEKCIIEEVNLK